MKGLKGLGKKQRGILNDLQINSDWYIQSVFDERELRIEVSMSDETNDYYLIDPRTLQKLIDRGLLKETFSGSPSLGIDVKRFRSKHK